MSKNLKEEYYSSDSSGGSDDEEVKKRGNFWYKKEKYDKAIDRFTRCLTLGQKNLQRQLKREKAAENNANGASSSATPSEASVSVSDEGKVTSSADSSNKKSTDSGAVLALKKKIAVFYSNRGLAYIGKERWREALEDCQKSIQTTPTDCPPKAWYNAARCYSQLKEYEDAVELIQKGTKILQKREVANRGALQNMKDLLSRAVGALQQKVDETVDLGKDGVVDPLYLYKKARLEKGNDYYRQNNLGEAIPCYEDVIKTLTMNPTETDEVAFKYAQAASALDLHRLGMDAIAKADAQKRKEEPAVVIEEVEDEEVADSEKKSEENNDSKSQADDNHKALSKSTAASSTDETDKSEEKSSSATLLEAKEDKTAEAKDATKDNTSDSTEDVTSNPKPLKQHIIHLPPIADAYKKMGFCFVKLREFPKAIDAYTLESKFLENMECDTQKSRENIATAYGNIGNCHKQMRNFPAAIEWAHKAIVKATRENENSITNDFCARSFQNLGNYHLQSSDDKDAQEKGRDCLEKSLGIYVELYGEEHGCTALGFLALSRCRIVPVQQRIGLLKSCLKILDVETPPHEYDIQGSKNAANFPKAPNNKASVLANNVNARRNMILAQLPEMPNAAVLENLVKNCKMVLGQLQGTLKDFQAGEEDAAKRKALTAGK